ncbi:VOC family protein [Cellulomonas sp. DKR-3]|uniref:VOC family protein n=1 Tax=Cellulomonas fulva TaxID=2835530 RepID=A0ABS5TYW5_9CELL|nr:VOC family protein [Cellulomonas fulva]MBT0994345.1 VOC family protein [Cellulomonas fulva]
MDRPSLRLTSVTIGTDRPGDLAAFYARLLGGRVTADDPPAPTPARTTRPERGPSTSALDEDRTQSTGAGLGWAQVVVPGGFTLNLEGEARFRRVVWPAVDGGQNATQHLDVQVEDLAAATAWALACGAELAAVQPQDDVRVLIDPSGHPFCLFT